MERTLRGLCAAHIVVENNSITDVCQLDEVHFYLGRVQPRERSPPCHSDLWFGRNQLNTGPGAALCLNSVDHAAVEDNVITLCQHDIGAPWLSARSRNITFGESNAVRSRAPQYVKKIAVIFVKRTLYEYYARATYSKFYAEHRACSLPTA